MDFLLEEVKGIRHKEIFWAKSHIFPARALRALGLLLALGAPTVGGGRLFDGSTKLFYGNSCNSGTESRKIVPKVGN